MTILEAAQALRSRAVSSAELTEAALKRIGERNPELNAMLATLEESARTQAKAADEELAEGADRGPLHGIPIAVKDVFETRGVRTTCGSVIFLHHIPDRDAAVVERLSAAGAVLVGKAGMHELAYGITSNNPHFGTIRNPRDPERIPGGSSGGSGAAVASEMVFMAMGRFDSHPGVVLRNGRTKAYQWPREPLRCDAARFLARSHGPADALGARCGSHPSGYCRIRFAG
jgi:aspartyl-tRNA(Asn)/glutamyl-tRNA(Gln) amidotransferase subunit A